MSTLQSLGIRVRSDGNLAVPICQRFADVKGYGGGHRFSANEVGPYWAVVDCMELPLRERRDGGFTLSRGGAVGWGGPWTYFEGLAPAAAFGRAARMSTLCSGYGVFEAAQLTAFCQEHLEDEHLLLIGRQAHPDEVDKLITRFAVSVNANPDTAHWTGQ